MAISRALATDAAAVDGPRLWWISDDGEFVSDRGVLNGQAVATDRPWQGIAARADRLLLWTDTALHLVDAHSGEVHRVMTVDRGGFERAGWAVDTVDTIEAYSHDTTGHPGPTGEVAPQVRGPTGEVAPDFPTAPGPAAPL